MPCPYKSGITADHFGVVQGHCRVLSIARWAIDITHPKLGDGNAVSLQIRDYSRCFGVVQGHCRVLSIARLGDD